MAKATQLTNNSWILVKDNLKNGLIQTVGDEYKILGGDYAGMYSSFKDIENTIKEELKEEQIVIRKEEFGDLNGFPLKHDTVFDVKKEKLYHSYIKKEGSLDRYAAGYFSVNHQGKYSIALCPRTTSLKEGCYKGPFKTKIECEHITRIENNK